MSILKIKNGSNEWFDSFIDKFEFKLKDIYINEEDPKNTYLFVVFY